MLTLSSHSFRLLSPLFSSPFHRLPSSSTRPSSTIASMAPPPSDFPYLPPADRELMLNLVSTVDDRLGSALLPSNVPPDVLRFQNSHGSAHGSVNIRSGSQSSPIDFVLQSWLNCKTPGGGGKINIATIFAFLDSSTDAPHLLLELIHGSPTSLVLIIDLLPRRDLVLHPDYLDEFYQRTDLDGPRQSLLSLPQVLPYYSSSLFIRSVLSPTAIAVSVNCGKEEGEMGEIVAEHIGGAAKRVIEVWLEKCACAGDVVGVAEGERVELERRDGLIKRKAVEIDLAANLPRMFGPEVAERVVAEIQKAFRV